MAKPSNIGDAHQNSAPPQSDFDNFFQFGSAPNNEEEKEVEPQQLQKQKSQGGGVPQPSNLWDESSDGEDAESVNAFNEITGIDSPEKGEDELNAIAVVDSPAKQQLLKSPLKAPADIGKI